MGQIGSRARQHIYDIYIYAIILRYIYIGSGNGRGLIHDWDPSHFPSTTLNRMSYVDVLEQCILQAVAAAAADQYLSPLLEKWSPAAPCEYWGGKQEFSGRGGRGEWRLAASLPRLVDDKHSVVVWRHYAGVCR